MFKRSVSVLFILAALGLLTAGGCGASGGTGGGTTPAPSPSITTIALTPATDLLLTGETVQFAGTASYSNGTTTAATGTWGSDALSVAAVDASGKVKAIGPGKATIWLEMQGVRGTRLLTVHPNFRGTWSGSFTVRACAHTGDFAAVDFCGGTVSQMDVIRLQVTQDRTSITGTIDLGGFASPMTGSVHDDGTLVVDAAVPVSPATVTLKDWKTRSDLAGSMTGEFALVWTVPPAAGSSEWSCVLSGMSRTSGGPQPAAMPVGAGGLIRAQAARITR